MRQWQKVCIFFILLVSTFYACSISWTESIRYGHLELPSFEERLTISVENNLVILPVRIQGKSYRFLFDTGAPFCISHHIQNESYNKVVSKGHVIDSDKNRKKVEWVSVDSIYLGDIAFINHTAFVTDFEANPILKCLQIDGIIGSNIIRQANWTLDQVNHSISFFSSDKLMDCPSCTEISFNTDHQYNVFIDIEIGKAVVRNLLVDYGASGSLSLSNDLFNTLKDHDVLGKIIVETGTRQTGVLGLETPVNRQRSILYSFQFAGKNLQRVVLKEGNTNAVGNSLLSNYTVTIDWKNQKLLLRGNEKSNRVRFMNGFALGYSNKKGVYVQSVIQNSPVYAAGLRPGMKILRLDTLDFTTENDYCDYIGYHFDHDFYMEVLDLEGVKHTVFCERKAL